MSTTIDTGREDLARLRVREYFERHHRPLYLVDCRPRTTEYYREVIGHWELLTIDPPLARITSEMLARFRATMLDPFKNPPPARHRGQYVLFPDLFGPAPRLRCHAPGTVNRALRGIGGILNKLGPPGPRNPEGLGVLGVVPWARKLREPKHRPRAVAPDIVSRLYEAAGVARHPQLAGVRPEAWWQALIVAACTLGSRRGALLDLEWDWIDLAGRQVRIPPESDKCNEERLKPIADILVAHLVRIRSLNPRVFAWPHSSATWYRDWWRIQKAAGLEARIKFHSLKATCATLYAASASPGVTQYMCDHGALSTTLRFYQDPLDEAREAANHLPLPRAFRTVG